MEPHRKIIKTLFGIPPERKLNPAVLIITNIRSIYDSIDSDFNKFSGWWDCKINEKIICVKIPQGTAVLDCITYLRKYTNKIIFLGYAGSINANYPIYSVVKISSAVRADENQKIYKKEKLDLSGQESCSVPAFCIENKQLFNKISQNIFDMESYYVIKYAKKYNKPCSIFLIVTDNPLKHPFFKQPNKSNLAKSINRIGDKIKNELT